MPESIHQGQRLKVLLKDNKIEKNYFADKLGISYTGFAYYYRLERLTTQIKERVYPLLRELGLNPDFIESRHASQKLVDARSPDEIEISLQKENNELLKRILQSLEEIKDSIKK